MLIVWDTVRAYSISSLRLSPRHHAEPDAVGSKAASSITSPSRRPHGHTPPIAASSPASGRSDSIPSGSSSSILAPNPGRVSGLAGLSNRRVRGEYELLQLRERAGAGLRPFRGLLALDRVSPHSHRSREMDPRKNPDSRGLRRRRAWRPIYDKKWVTLQSRGAREINDGFLDWLSRRRTRSSLLRFPELLRRPRAVRAPRGI